MANLSRHYGLAQALKTQFNTWKGTTGHALAWVTGDVVVRAIPWGQDFTKPGSGVELPGILITYFTPERITPASNLKEDIEYPIPILIMRAKGADWDSGGDQLVYTRQYIQDAYRFQALTISDPATDFHDCRVDSGPVIDWNLMIAENVMASSFTLRFKTRQGRV